MLAEHARLMKPPEAKPMDDAEFDDNLAALRALNLQDVKV